MSTTKLIGGSYNSTELVTPNHTAITGGANVKGVYIPPTPHLTRGDVERWANEAGVSSERIIGYWLEKKGVDIPINAPPRPDEKVILSFHAGVYVKFSAHPDDVTSNPRHELLKYTRSIDRIFSLEYRVSRRDSRSGKSINPFPAALIDAVAGYSYLVNEVGFAPKNIILMGDSAGAHLSLALSRYLRDRRMAGDTDIPELPGGMLLISPWVELPVSTSGPHSSAIRNRNSDFVDVISKSYNRCTQTFLGNISFSASASNPYLSPASLSPAMDAISFAGFPPAYILAGGAEGLLDSIRVLRKRMAADLGEEAVKYVEFPDSIHVFCSFEFHEPERTQALQGAAKWLESL